MGDCSRAYGDGYYGDCLYGGADATIPGYVAFPDSNGNTLKVPPSTDWDIGPEGVTAIFRLRRAAWSGSGNDVWLACKQNATDTGGWEIRNPSGGALQFLYYNGTSNVTRTFASTGQMTALPTNEWVWIAAVFVADDGANSRATSWVSYDGATWEVLGSPTSAAALTLLPTDNNLTIGSHDGGGNPFSGDIGYVALYQGTDGDEPGGALVFEFNGTEIVDPDATSFVAVSGQTVSVFRGNTPLTIHPAIPGDCELCFTNDPCPQQIPDSSSHMDRWDEMVPCPPGGNC